MDPVAVLRTIWQQRWFALPAILLVFAAVAYVYVAGPRTYESSQAFALANPRVPTEKEIDADPSLLDLNSDNPYLRSSDPNLVSNVVITLLNAAQTGDRLAALGITTEYQVSSGALGGGLVISINASGDTPSESTTAVNSLGTLLREYLHQVQTVNGANDRYLFTAIVVSEPSKPTEKLSSRLRTVVIVAIAGVAVVFGAVSLGTWISNSRTKKQMASAVPRSGADTDSTDELDGTGRPSQSGRRRRYESVRARRASSSSVLPRSPD